MKKIIRLFSIYSIVQCIKSRKFLFCGIADNVPAVITSSSQVTKSSKEIPDSDTTVFHSAKGEISSVSASSVDDDEKPQKTIFCPGNDLHTKTMIKEHNTVKGICDGLISNKYTQKTMLKERNTIIRVYDGLISNKYT
ncbi:Protein of unknown function [Cotesia congregata]|uniref:Uncharacterized protein n=1 Tax=Cotesia congregata TaxID=51543 RepID=A0A8J2MMW6_COTCN|nr:Protein of unknown function [Cotesia congregata]